MNALDEIEAEVKRRADELTPELLPTLLERFLKRSGVTTCDRHFRHLIPYVNAQIALTQAKRRYLGDYPGNALAIADSYHFSLKRRDEVRATYRSTPCTCWVPKR